MLIDILHQIYSVRELTRLLQAAKASTGLDLKTHQQTMAVRDSEVNLVVFSEQKLLLGTVLSPIPVYACARLLNPGDLYDDHRRSCVVLCASLYWALWLWSPFDPSLLGSLPENLGQLLSLGAWRPWT